MSTADGKLKSRPFVSDVAALRRRARKHLEQGAVTEAYNADRKQVIRILNEVLATALVSVLRNKRHHYMASGIEALPVAAAFRAHANDEMAHADLAATRITQLGGAPDFNPEFLAKRSHSEYAEGNSLLDMVQENLIAERIAVESYSDIIRYLGEDDPSTRSVMEEILAAEEEHASEMKKLLDRLHQK
jgi:bacterioferritin